MILPYVMNISALSVSPAYPCDHTVFMGTDGSGMFRTTDTSTDSVWMPINNGLFDLGILSLVVSPNYGRCDRLTDRGDRTLFVATRSGIFRSQNGGATWELRSQGLPSGQIAQSLGISPNFASDRTIYAGFDGSVFRSTDAAANWSPFDAGLTDRSVQAFALSANYANDNTLFVGTRFSGVFRIAARLQQAAPVASPAPPPAGTPSASPTPARSTRAVTGAAAASPSVRDVTVEVISGPGNPSATEAPAGAPPATVQSQPLQRAAGALQVILWACNPSGSLCAADGAEWTTVPGLVLLKMEIKNIGTQSIRNLLVTDDNGTPDNTSDDILVNAGNPALELGPGAVAFVQRQLVVNSDRGASGATAPFIWSVNGVCGPTFDPCSPAAAASDDAIVRVVSTKTKASLRMEVTAGGSFVGQTFYTIPGSVPLILNVINDGNESVRAVQLILDAAGNDSPGCSDNPETESINETLDDVIVGNVPSLGPGQQTTITTSINVRPRISEEADPTATFKPIRIQSCSAGTAGDASNPLPVIASGSMLVQLVVWQSITPSASTMSNLWVTSFATSPFYANDQTIFAGTSYGGLYRSTNAATTSPTWELVNEGLDPTFTWIRAITLSPRYPFDRTLYVGTESGVFRGTEVGAGGPISWVPVNQGLNVRDVRALGISPDYGRDSIVFAGAYGADVYRLKATANDIPWEPYRRVINGLWSWSIALTQEGVLLNGTWGRGVGRAVLGTGSDWSYSQPGLAGEAEVTALTLSPGYCSGYTAFAGTWGHGLYRSGDAGATWTATGYSVGYGPIRDVAVAPSYARGNTLAVATWGGGVLISHNDGVTWSPINTGLTDLKVRSIAFSPGYPTDQTLFAGTDGAGLFRYDASRGHWTALGGGLPGGSVMALALSPQYMGDGTVFAGTWGSGIALSRDRGATWSRAGAQPNPYVRSLVFSASYATDGTIYAGTNRGLYRSSDRGGSWNLVGAATDEVSTVDVTDVAVTMTVPRTIFVSTGGRGIWQFIDSTVSSYQTNNFLYRAYIPAIAKGRVGGIC